MGRKEQKRIRELEGMLAAAEDRLARADTKSAVMGGRIPRAERRRTAREMAGMFR